LLLDGHADNGLQVSGPRAEPELAGPDARDVARWPAG
jgi:hypothetical protein